MTKVRFYYCEKCKNHFSISYEEVEEKGLHCVVNKCLKNNLVYLGNETSSEESKQKRYDEFVVNKKEDYYANPAIDDQEDSYKPKNRITRIDHSRGSIFGE